MKRRTLYLLTLITLLSCSKQINVFRTGTLSSKNYCDTLSYDKNNKYIVLPVIVNGKLKKMMFDTGADIVVLPKDSSISNIKCNLSDINGNVTQCNITPIYSLGLSNNNFTNLYSFNLDLPTPFLCFADGIIGNNVIKTSNWLINENNLVFSNRPFDIIDKQVSLDIFYYNSNGLFTNLIINGNRLDTCLIDYGGLYDIELSKSFYEKNLASFKPNKITHQIYTSYGANGKSLPDTVFRLKCDINFNGLEIDSVNIVIKNKGKNRIGFQFLKRFEQVAINNIDQKFVFGRLFKTPKSSQQECIFSFDLTNGFFVVDSKILNESNSSGLNIDDKFIEINTIKSSEFKNYCDFLVFKDSLIKLEYLDLKTIDNKMIRINNRL